MNGISILFSFEVMESETIRRIEIINTDYSPYITRTRKVLVVRLIIYTIELYTKGK